VGAVANRFVTFDRIVSALPALIDSKQIRYTFTLLACALFTLETLRCIFGIAF
jgi:hypothetical protein